MALSEEQTQQLANSIIGGVYDNLKARQSLVCTCLDAAEYEDCRSGCLLAGKPLQE